MKGISPIIASVILIALTLAIAGVFSLWATSFVQTRQVQFEEQLQCMNALEIDRKAPSLTYSFDNETEMGSLNVIVINKGSAMLENLKAIITYPTQGVKNYDFGISLNPGEGRALVIQENPEKPLRVRLFSDKCSLLGEVDIP
ncbi:MAG: hypothetical protein HYW25_02835 [Candidatus Aenigmarchaeota archaeon]|nr:hypothetical protein [Candidatus Aenigmarchaeota archaeon]